MSGHRQLRVVMGERREVWELTTEVDFSWVDQQRTGADQTNTEEQCRGGLGRR